MSGRPYPGGMGKLAVCYYTGEAAQVDSIKIRVESAYGFSA